MKHANRAAEHLSDPNEPTRSYDTPEGRITLTISERRKQLMHCIEEELEDTARLYGLSVPRHQEWSAKVGKNITVITRKVLVPTIIAKEFGA